MIDQNKKEELVELLTDVLCDLKQTEQPTEPETEEESCCEEDYDDICMPCRIAELEEEVSEKEELIELLTAHNEELEKELEDQTELIDDLESTIDDFESAIDDIEEEDNNDYVEDCNDCGKGFYAELVDSYYKDGFSLQQIFKMIGKKAVEVEFQKFLMSQE